MSLPQTTSPEKPPRAAVYLRVSSKAQAEPDRYSLPTQEEACRAYCAQHGYAVEEEHVYQEVHGADELWERPQLTRLREAVRHREVDVVVSYCLDRFSRDPVHQAIVICEADHAGVATEFVLEPLDNSPEGQLIRFVKGYAAHYELESIKERTMRGKLARVNSGKLWRGGRPLYGYAWRPLTEEEIARSPKKKPSPYALNLDELTAPVMARAYRMLLTGMHLQRICRQFTAEGIPTPSGQRIWKSSTLADMLRQPGYCGRAYAWRWKMTRSGGRTRRCDLRDESEWIELPTGTIPAIVDEPTWEAAQVILDDNRDRVKRRVKHPESHLLRGGYAVCGYCGSPMYCGQDGDGVAIYYCGARKQLRKGTCAAAGAVRAHLVDPQVWSFVEDVLTKPEIIAGEIAKLRQDDPTESGLAEVERQITEIVRQQARLSDRVARAEDDDVAGPLLAHLGLLGRHKKQCLAEREKLLATRGAWQHSQDNLVGLQQWRQGIADRLGSLGYEERQLALFALGVRVKVYQRGHVPRFEVEVSLPLGDVGTAAATSTSYP